MPIERRLAALLGSLAVVAATSGCELLAPTACPELYSSGVDGLWNLETVDGKVLPDTGLKIPLRSENLFAGSIQFRSSDWEGSCADDDVKGSSGTALATYRLLKNGVTKPSKTYTGSFEFDNNTIKLRGDGYEFPATRSGSTFTVNAEYGFLKASLMFRKAPLFRGATVTPAGSSHE